MIDFTNVVHLFFASQSGVRLGARLEGKSRSNKRTLLGLPESTREEGVYSFANEPPPIGNQAVRDLWTRLLPKWQDADTEHPDAIHPRAPTVDEVRKLAESPEMMTSQSDWVSGELDQVVIKRLIKGKKGSWYQMPAWLRRGGSA